MAETLHTALPCFEFGGVVHSEILLPAHATPAFSDRSTLWNSVELSEKSNNAQLAREVEIALPVEQ